MRNLYIKLLLFFPVLCLAQIPTIETADGKGGYEKNNQVILQKLNIETKIVGPISTNVVTMVFKNNSNRLREGRLTFPLPEGVNASGYALDINGKLRNAVPVEKEKAKEVYETIKKRNVDPGVLEKVEGNNFRTTIYPINANGGERTVQITYNYELKKSGNNYQYFLPLNYTSEIPEFNIKTSVFQNTDSPQLEEKPDESFDFAKNGNIWVAETHKTKYKPGNNLKINFPQNNENQSVLIQKASGDSSYFLANLNVNPNERAKKLPNKLAIVWDNSLSGKKRDHVKEWSLLEEYFKTNKNVTVKTYFINNTFDEGKTFKINDGNWDELKSYLSQTIYDGGTDFGQLKSLREDEILFFTDGLSSFGELKLGWNKPTYTISSSNNVNFNQLKFISNKTGGEFLNLNENDPKKEVSKLLFQPLKFLGIEDNSSLSETYPSLIQTISQDFVLTGILKGNQTTIKAKFGYGNEVTETKTIILNINEQAVKDWEISKFWAQKKLNELEIFEKQNKEDIKNLSKQFGLVSNNMSLMVLENVEDYVRYDITPPAELRTQFNEIVKNNRAEKDVRVNDLMNDAEEMTRNLKEWWKKEYKQKEKSKRHPEPNQYSSDIDYATGRNQNIEEVVVRGIVGVNRERTVEPEYTPSPATVSSPVADEAPRPQADEAVEISKSGSPIADRSNRIEEVVMVGYGVRKKQESVTSASSVVTSGPVREKAQISVRGMSSIASNVAIQALEGRVAGLEVRKNSENESPVNITSSGRMNVIDVNSKAEYMKLFNEAKSAEAIYQIYLKNRKEYENLPQYYFDVSQLLFKNNDKKSGLKVLSSIADLDIENEELYKLLAYKLKQAEVFDKELFVTQKVLEWRPFDPQSYRDYALALEDNKQYQGALDNLYKVLTQSYTQELANRDDGIEETIIMEINQLIDNYRNKLDLKNINPKIIADLPVDVRVVINWNKDDTDIDLWVTDPNNERCYYSHSETEIGGRLSNDFTSGFGPEQFLLKKAIKGKYKIQTNFFGERQVGIAGPTAIMAEVYINYATGRQERKIVVFQNQKDSERGSEDGILIGEFEF
ncbi:Ca-activated chloride channel family protein [Chryseobacterium ginsenosidimutans]|uniref:VIT domain-containing protein n=1 Tax=Chryseobacterium ginsenosidimutans TaxID=687846 RepID=UPI00278579C0|nr:VIT domain-containing protein [Chryseobacterium ginsenosidimutans]MDQ0595568.1 Ca-activated chloride channel family protein [Chryseobacterium ginsenosidimutans]